MSARPTVAILGASGLIGHAVATALARDGFTVLAIARRFTRAQAASLPDVILECPIAALDTEALARLLGQHGIDIVVNCLGVLQDGPRGRTDAIHRDFTARLLAAMAARPNPPLLIHLSVPGHAEQDTTAFSRTKRAGERLIEAAQLPFVILRPGFVVAPTAYGGSALVRAFAAVPALLPADAASRPFAATAMEDITRTIALVAQRWRNGERQWAATWDVMERTPSSIGAVIEAFRHHFGGPRPVVRLPAWLLSLGARVGDLVARLGWTPPVRTTPLREMLRGIDGDPTGWIAATGLEPADLAQALVRLPATIQERWFARLFLAKPLILGTLALFWIVSGAIALTVGFDEAAAVLVAHGVPPWLAAPVTALTSAADILVGLTIAVRKTCRTGLLAGIALSLVYMASAIVLTPELWLDPLGPLVKTGPAIVLMAVALMILDDR